jgi:hypothetical protein
MYLHGFPDCLYAASRREGSAKADRGTFPEDFYVICGSPNVTVPSHYRTITHEDPLASFQHLHTQNSETLAKELTWLSSVYG